MATYHGVRRGVEANLGITDGSTSETLIFLSDPELSLGDQYEDVISTEGFPEPGVTQHALFSQLTCSEVNIRKMDNHTHGWEVDVEFSIFGTNSSGSLDSETAPAPQWGDSPEDWFPIIKTGTERRMVNADANRSTLMTKAAAPTAVGAAIPSFYISEGKDFEILVGKLDFTLNGFASGFMTVAGEVYSSPAIQVPEDRDVLEITRFEKAFFIGGSQVSWPEYKDAILGRVNQYSFFQYPPRTVKIDDISGDIVWRYQSPYVRVTYRLLIDLNYPGRNSYTGVSSISSSTGGVAMTSSHDPIIMHGGFQSIDAGGSSAKILDDDDNPMDNPWPIAPCSNWRAIEDDDDFQLSFGEAFPRDVYSQGKPVYLPFICHRKHDEFDFRSLNFNLEKYYPVMFVASS